MSKAAQMLQRKAAQKRSSRSSAYTTYAASAGQGSPLETEIKWPVVVQTLHFHSMRTNVPNQRMIIFHVNAVQTWMGIVTDTRIKKNTLDTSDSQLCAREENIFG